jgi:flagellar basal-body rod protein FlgF
MDAAMYKALSGAVAQMHRLDVASQDLANVNTSGYKGQRLSFNEVLAKRLPADDRPGGFVAIGDQRTQFNPGVLQTTGDPFHLAIEGDGFFVVQTAAGERYTRNGNFTMKSDGTVVTPAGDALLGEGGPLLLTGRSFEVAADGMVRSMAPDAAPGSEPSDIGKLRIVRFTDARNAQKEGANLFRGDPTNVADASDTRVLQGSLEQSNVSPIDSMISLISINRQFEAYEHAMKLMDATTEKMINDSSQ